MSRRRSTPSELENARSRRDRPHPGLQAPDPLLHGHHALAARSRCSEQVAEYVSCGAMVRGGHPAKVQCDDATVRGAVTQRCRT